MKSKFSTWSEKEEELMLLQQRWHDLIQPYTPARQLGSASDTQTFVTPRVNTKTFGEKSFSYAGPSVWHNLPQTLRHSDSAVTMHLFNKHF